MSELRITGAIEGTMMQKTVFIILCLLLIHPLCLIVGDEIGTSQRTRPRLSARAAAELRSEQSDTSRLRGRGRQTKEMTPSPHEVAAAVDYSLWGQELDSSVPQCDDAAFLRRIMLDTVGRPAAPGEITAFGLDPASDRRDSITQKLLNSEEYGRNWAGYWADAIFLRATNMRAGLVRPAFEDWMTEQLNSGKGWNEIVTSLITATGSVNSNGATALIFAHEGVAEEIAAETSRLFLGVQIQCANCHDHPWDSWKRTQFHQFTAFFPRVSVRRDPASDRPTDFEVASVNVDRNRGFAASRFLLERLDRNRDGILSEEEAQGTQIARIFNGPAKAMIDRNGDGKLSLEEIATAQPPERPGQGSAEHYMADLNDPGARGEKVDPAFFLNDRTVRPGMTDTERRSSAAGFVTGNDNPWFARAVVCRIWYEMTGTAFYSPVDDIGPERECVHEETLQILSDGFVASGYDLKWLIHTIALTRTYQRAPNNVADGFARCEPVRLRSDQVYAGLCQTLGVSGLPLRPTGGQRVAPDQRRVDPGRQEFARLFGFDPSTPRDELMGSTAEALFLMNSQMLTRLIAAPSGSSPIQRITSIVPDLEGQVSELYLTALGREPTGTELQVSVESIQESVTVRSGLEDLLWALINSPEFCAKR